MNCKPGDLAIIIHPRLFGTEVTVLYQTPDYFHNLPDGTLAGPARSDKDWTLEFSQTIDLPMSDGTIRQGKYGSCHDKWLRPIGNLLPLKEIEVEKTV